MRALNCMLSFSVTFQIGYILGIPVSEVKVPISAEDNYYIEGLEFLVRV